MFFKKILLAFVVLAIGISSTFAGVLKEKTNLTQKCEVYAKEIGGKNIGDVYPYFSNKNGKQMNRDGFSYLNLNSGKTDAFIRVYEFKNASLEQAYENLKSILKKNANIKIRSVLPKKNAEDALEYEESVDKDENDGYTCYVYKGPSELWINSIPQKGEEFIFILKQVGENSKLYYYEKITFKD
ncbi:hypothetical protein [Campylobacter sp. US33a]|uniref:hypothetical protein n=1 Tax=Campylobacter sp. US33a TaxID=2498120 RepID=UPI001068B5EA|nr:hypothetical protein [Campylobacter sp. US33a]TEY03985.1 hypothetical protein ELQ16_01755 [Campylobacter sp. US33a]